MNSSGYRIASRASGAGHDLDSGLADQRQRRPLKAVGLLQEPHLHRRQVDQLKPAALHAALPHEPVAEELQAERRLVNELP